VATNMLAAHGGADQEAQGLPIEPAKASEFVDNDITGCRGMRMAEPKNVSNASRKKLERMRRENTLVARMEHRRFGLERMPELVR
jgi:hypothetical protein